MSLNAPENHDSDALKIPTQGDEWESQKKSILDHMNRDA